MLVEDVGWHAEPPTGVALIWPRFWPNMGWTQLFGWIGGVPGLLRLALGIGGGNWLWQAEQRSAWQNYIDWERSSQMNVYSPKTNVATKNLFEGVGLYNSRSSEYVLGLGEASFSARKVARCCDQKFLWKLGVGAETTSSWRRCLWICATPEFNSTTADDELRGCS